MRLLSISKAVGKIKFSIFFTNLVMKQSRNPSNQQLSYVFNAKKRSLPQQEDDDFQQPLPIKKISKVFQHSLTFADTNHSFADTNLAFSNTFNSTSHQRDSDALKISIPEERNFTTQLRKCEQKEDFSQKIERMKHFLPKHLNFRLSKPHKEILLVASEIDIILSSKIAFQYMESLQNIENQLKISFEGSLLQFFKQINYLCRDHYKYYRDPLKNIAIGLPSMQTNLSLRKYKLKKILYQSNSIMEHTMSQSHTLPEEELIFGKTELFCPNTIKKKIQQPNSQQIFKQNIEKEIHQKQVILQQYLIEDEPVKFEDIEAIIEHIIGVFIHYKVKHMFKVNLVQSLQKKDFHLKLVCSLLQHITKTGFLLHIYENSKQSIIYELRTNQKDKILLHFKKLNY